MNKAAKALRRENNAREEALSPASQAGMTDVVVYLRVQDLSQLTQEEIRRDILEMVLAGEQRGQTMAQVVGEDYKAFCDEIVAAVPRRSRLSRILSGVDTILPALTILQALWVAGKVVVALSAGASLMALPCTAGDLLALGILLAAAVGLVHFICRTALDQEDGGPAKPLLGLLLLLVALFLSHWVFRASLFTISLPLAVVAAVLPLVVSLCLARRRDL